MIETLEQELVIRVGIAEGTCARAPYKIRTTGLGSCVGLVLYDSVTKVGGLVHIMLPEAPDKSGVTAQKYANLAVPWLIESIRQEGGATGRLKAKLAGGSQMFATAGKSDIMRVGPRNTEAVLSSLKSLGIPVVSSDVGGNVGRTIEFDIETETLHVRTAMKGNYVI